MYISKSPVVWFSSIKLTNVSKLEELWAPSIIFIGFFETSSNLPGTLG